MRKWLNIAALVLCVATALVATWFGVQHLGLEIARAALRFAAGPAVVLAGFAFTVVTKVHDLAEIGGLSIPVIDRLTPRVTVVQRRLWLLIGLTTLATVVGWIAGAVTPEYASQHGWVTWASVGCLATLLTVTMITVVYLPAVHIDYTAFRARAVRQVREDQKREEALQRLSQGYTARAHEANPFNPNQLRYVLDPRDKLSPP